MIYKDIYRTILVYSLMCFAWCSLAPFANAQNSSFSLRVAPAVITFTMLHPQQMQQNITLENTGSNTLTFISKLVPFTPASSADGSVDYPYKDPLPENYQRLFASMRLVQNEQPVTSITLAPYQKTSLVLSLQPDKTIKESDYYFSILFISNQEGTASNFLSDKSSLLLTPAIAIHTLVAIGSENPKPAIKTFEAPTYVEHGPVRFTLRVANKGSHLFAAGGILSLRNMFGQTIGNVRIPPQTILAKSDRYLRNQAPPDDHHQPEVVWNEPFLLGWYSATFSLHVNGSNPVEQTVTFIAFPFSAFIGMLIGAFIVGMIAIRMKKRLYK